MRMTMTPGAAEMTPGAAEGHLLLDPSSALDLAAFVVDGVDLSPGSAIPSDGDPRIDHALKGFLFTCGPEHIRHPEPIAAGRGSDTGAYPLHGSLAGTRVAERDILSTPTASEARFSCRLADGGEAEIWRRWSIGAGGWVHLDDRITNIGSSAFPAMCMYHVNLGGSLLGAETRVSGGMLPEGGLPWRFGEGESAHVCLPAASSNGEAQVRLGPIPALGQRSLELRFATDSLPFFQMWRCQRGGADVLSLEPVSHRIAKRPALAEAGELPALLPGRSISYALAFRVAAAEA
ncbi:DUF4432 family protein [Rhizobium sp. YIM 134829]|uniref:DUF4432 family protein n=1 Tax=Rhizobium sp. YIM 134829 TaxID=3390453 RepID=UPI003979AC24